MSRRLCFENDLRDRRVKIFLFDRFFLFFFIYFFCLSRFSKKTCPSSNATLFRVDTSRVEAIQVDDTDLDNLSLTCNVKWKGNPDIVFAVSGAAIYGGLSAGAGWRELETRLTHGIERRLVSNC